MRRLSTHVLLALSFLLACQRKPGSGSAATPKPVSRPTPQAGRLRILEQRPDFEQVRKAPLTEARAELDALYRLRPDRRFLAGIAATKRVLRGTNAVSIELRFASGSWSIACDGETAGTLPEFPSYADELGLLRAWTQRLAAKDGGPAAAADFATIDAEIVQFSPSHLVRALTEVDRRWNKSAPDPRLARRAGRAITLLLFQSFDRLELTNDIAGSALASLVIAESLGGERVESEVVLLAAMLGYVSEARAMASRLDARDPVRLYLEGKTKALQSLAEQRPSDRFLGYLAVRSLTGPGRVPEWEAWVGSHFLSEETTLATLHAELELDEFESSPRCAQAVLGTWMNRLDPQPMSPNPQSDAPDPPEMVQRLLDDYFAPVREALRRRPAGLLRRFEDGLGRQAAAGTGPFWGKEDDRAWARASFYGAVYVLGRHYLDQLSSAEDAAWYASFLQDAPAGLASDYVGWYQNLAFNKGGQGEAERLAEDIRTRRLGFLAASRSFDYFRPTGTADARRDTERVAALALALDTRPAARIILLLPLRTQDPIRLMRLCQHCRDLSNTSLETWNGAWCASVLGDSAALLRAASDSSQPVERRARSLQQLEIRVGVPPALIASKYQKLVVESGYEGQITEVCIFYLERIKKYGEELEVIDGYLARNPADNLTRTIYRARRAHALSLLGRNAEAWRVIEPELSSWQAAAMSYGASILWSLGRSDEALALSRRTVERYPDSPEIRADLARLLWSALRYSEAALVLGDGRFSNDLAAWKGTFAGAFFESFRKLPPDAAIRAFEVLRAQKVGYWMLESIPDRLGSEGLFEHSARLYEDLPGMGSWEYPWSKARAYQYLSKWKGEVAAREWVLANYDPKMRQSTTQAMYATGNGELLWILQEPPPEPSSLTWLMRAASARSEGLDRHPHREQLLAHFQQPNSTQDVSFALGRYLMGLETEGELLAMKRAPEDDDLVAYTLGLQAYAEGRLLEAGDWLQLAPLRGKRLAYNAADLSSKIAEDVWRDGLSASPAKAGAAR